LGNAIYVWRSGIGITADGALVYVGGPGLNITDLADLLVRAGAVRAMELDINTDWVNFSVYQPATPSGPASGANGSELLPAMTGTPARYFEPGGPGTSSPCRRSSTVDVSAREQRDAQPTRTRPSMIHPVAPTMDHRPAVSACGAVDRSSVQSDPTA
jgi:hypothetical protein